MVSRAAGSAGRGGRQSFSRSIRRRTPFTKPAKAPLPHSFVRATAPFTAAWSGVSMKNSSATASRSMLRTTRFWGFT